MDATIIIPVYNSEKYLERCLISIINQRTNYIYEIILIDDCCTDSSSSIISRYLNDNQDLIKVITNDQNRGQGFSKDEALKLAEGDYILYVDSDDFIDADYVQTMILSAKQQDVDVLISNYMMVFGKDNKKNVVRKLNKSEWTLFYFSAGWGKIFRRSFLIKNNIKYGDYKYGEDTHFNLMLFVADASISFVDYAGYYYCANDLSISRSKSYDKNFEREICRVYNSICRSIVYSELSLIKKQMIEYSYITDMLSTLIVQNRGCGKKKMCEKISFFLHDLYENYPSFHSNPFIGFTKPRGQVFKIKVAVATFCIMEKLGLTKSFFNIFA